MRSPGYFQSPNFISQFIEEALRGDRSLQSFSAAGVHGHCNYASGEEQNTARLEFTLKPNFGACLCCGVLKGSGGTHSPYVYGNLVAFRCKCGLRAVFSSDYQLHGILSAAIAADLQHIQHLLSYTTCSATTES